MCARKVTTGRVLDVLSSGRSALLGRDESVVVRVHVDEDCPRDLVLAVKGALVPERPCAVVRVGPLAEPSEPSSADVAIVLLGTGSAERVVASYAGSGVPVALVVEGALDAPHLDLTDQAAALVSLIAASSPSALLDKLASWLASATDKCIALAANFPFCRRAVTDLLVARCAAQNAAVGAVHLIPGSDLPVMTVNQAKLALDIAAAHNEGLDASRVAELASVVGAGLAYRAVARTLLGLVPGLGAVLRAGVGYAGTIATGNALRLRFEQLGQAGTVARDARAGQPSSRALFSPAPKTDDDGYVTIGEGVS